MDALIVDVMNSSRGRMVGDGIRHADIEEILERCNDWDDWYEVVTDIGDRYERVAKECLKEGHRISAGELLWRSSMYYHYAQFYMFSRPDLREKGQKRKVELYKRAAPLFFPSAERIEIDFEDFVIPGYLRVPEGSGPFPCVILLGGLESTKEESFLFERMCLDRGLATFAFDGPGQGEMFFQTPIRPDFERFTSAVIDYLEKREEVDPTRFGILGRSLGGHYAPKSAAHDQRISVCVCWGALYELDSYWDEFESFTKRGFVYCSGNTDPDVARESLKVIDLAGWADRIRCSLYIQHGKLDQIIPFHQAERLEREAVNAREIVTQFEPRGNHCCHNLYHMTRHPMVDHLTKVLNFQP